MGKFQPKTRDELKTEILANYGDEISQELVDKMVEDRYKDEEFKAAEKNKTAKAREMLEQMTKAKEFYKKSGSKGTQQPKQAELSTEDKSYLFSRGYTRTEVRHLEKVIKTTGKGLDKALQDNLFTTWKKDNDALITRRGSGLPASRGGGSKETPVEQKIVDKFSQNLPAGFKYNKIKI